MRVEFGGVINGDNTATISLFPETPEDQEIVKVLDDYRLLVCSRSDKQRFEEATIRVMQKGG